MTGLLCRFYLAIGDELHYLDALNIKTCVVEKRIAAGAFSVVHSSRGWSRTVEQKQIATGHQ